MQRYLKFFATITRKAGPRIQTTVSNIRDKPRVSIIKAASLGTLIASTLVCSATESLVPLVSEDEAALERARQKQKKEELLKKIQLKQQEIANTAETAATDRNNDQKAPGARLKLKDVVEAISTGASLQTDPETVFPEEGDLASLTHGSPAQANRVVVFVDGSEESELAFKSALRCKRKDDILYVVNYSATRLAVPPLSYDADVTDVTAVTSVTDQKNHENAQHIFHKLRKMIPSNEANIIFVSDTTNDPASAAIEFAKNEHVNLIVVGSRCHSIIGRVLLGSFTNYVTNHSPCSVYIVRPPQHEDTVPATSNSLQSLGTRAIEAVKGTILSSANSINNFRQHGFNPRQSSDVRS